MKVGPMRVVVTGGAGNIGSVAVAEQLQEFEAEAVMHMADGLRRTSGIAEGVSPQYMSESLRESSEQHAS